MHKRGVLQVVTGVMLSAIGGAFLLGQALDSVQNAFALVSPFVTYAGTGVLLGGAALLDVALRMSPQKWTRGGTHFRISALGPLVWAPVLGAVGLLWVPRFLSTAPAVPARPQVSMTLPTSFFPHYVGTTWTYVFGRLAQEGSGSASRIQKQLGHYSDTVVVASAGAAPTVRTIGVQRTGLVPRLLQCTTGRDSDELVIQGDAELWLVTDERRVFETCTRDAAAELALQLAKVGSTTKLPPPEYVLPLVVGSLWGADPDLPRRTDDAYQWLVDGEENVETPAGRFTDCYRLIYSTLPDHQLRWVCRGVGLVAWEYHHHGTIEEYRAELTAWTVPAER